MLGMNSAIVAEKAGGMDMQSNLYEIISRVRESENRIRYINSRLTTKNHQMVTVPEELRDDARVPSSSLSEKNPLIITLIQSLLDLENAINAMAATVSITETI